MKVTSRRARHRLALVAVVLATIVGVMGVWPASGHYLWHEDPAGDTGKGTSFFDLSGVRLFQKSGPPRGIVRIRTHEPIELAQVPLVRVYFDSRGGNRADRVVVSAFDGGSSGFICQITHVRRIELEDCEVTADDRLWQLTFRWGALDAKRHVRWWVEAIAGERDDPARDRAPDEGWFEH